jgi:hypothetical protein
VGKPKSDMWRLDTPPAVAVAVADKLAPERLADAFVQVHLYGPAEGRADRLSVFTCGPRPEAVLNVAVPDTGAAELRRLTADYLKAVAVLAARETHGGAT